MQAVVKAFTAAVLSNRYRPFKLVLEGGAPLYAFSFAQGAPAFSEIFDSVFATPARYVEEIARRLVELRESDSDTLLIFNPAKNLSAKEISAGLNAMPSLDHTRPAVLSDHTGRVLAYALPGHLEPQKFELLRALSTSDATIDAELLSHITSSPCAAITIPGIDLAAKRTNGFFSGYEKIYTECARRSLSALRKSDEQTPPTLAIMPNHAGDVLFLALALTSRNDTATEVLVHEAFAPILHAVSPQTPLATIGGAVPGRTKPGQQAVPALDRDYFFHISDALPENYITHYLRPSRDFTQSRHHFIDLFAFSLGSSLRSENELPTHRATPPHAAAQRTQRVLVHFGAGWPLKIYPKHWQQPLVDKLSADGWTVTVLADSDITLNGCATIKTDRLDDIRDLIANADLMIGMDSFPAHWAVNIAGKPTIGLFGSTRLSNAAATYAPAYAALERNLSCNPCGEMTSCPLYRTSYCLNFAVPDVVAAEAQQLFEQSLQLPPRSAFEWRTDKAANAATTKKAFAHAVYLMALPQTAAIAVALLRATPFVKIGKSSAKKRAAKFKRKLTRWIAKVFGAPKTRPSPI